MNMTVKKMRFRLAFAMALGCACTAYAADLGLPATLNAGHGVTFTAPGNGEASGGVSPLFGSQQGADAHCCQGVLATSSGVF